jgi:hypothetical protein
MTENGNVDMAKIEINLPTSLIRDIHSLAKTEGIAFDSFMLWAVAEKVGELKFAFFQQIIHREIEPSGFYPPKYPSLQIVIPQTDYFLHFEFSSGLEGTFEMKPLIEHEVIFSSLANPEAFMTLKVSKDGDFLQWTDIPSGKKQVVGMGLLYDFIRQTKHPDNTYEEHNGE